MNLSLQKLIVSVPGIVACLCLTACGSDDISGADTPAETDGYRAPDAGSVARATTVFEYTPAPGQFINEASADMTWSESTTPADAALWAQGRLDKGLYVSLGAFGGYIVAGFDHSIAATAHGHEIGVAGNAFNSPAGDSNEPGIVYVMQDTNHNGLPDDVWYELRGSETLLPQTIRDYEVTYHKPSGEGQPVEWTDNRGGSGKVPYMGMFHKQPSYFPVWVSAPTYTLRGTCLQSKSAILPSGNRTNPPFEWGYADNCGSDAVVWNDYTNMCRFNIADAIDADGNPMTLPYIDFVKIQTGLQAIAGVLGEVSTEVLGIVDLTLQ